MGWPDSVIWWHCYPLRFVGAEREGIDHVEHRLQVLVLDDRGHRRLARGLEAVGGHRDDHLANILDLAVGQQRVAGDHRADVELAGYVVLGDGYGHAGEVVAGADVQLGEKEVLTKANGTDEYGPVSQMEVLQLVAVLEDRSQLLDVTMGRIACASSVHQV